MQNVPNKIYLNLGDIEHEDVKDFNELSGISWSTERIDDSDIEYIVKDSKTADNFDADKWLGEQMDIWNHPTIADRNNKNSYEVSELMAEFAKLYYRKGNEDADSKSHQIEQLSVLLRELLSASAPYLKRKKMTSRIECNLLNESHKKCRDYLAIVT